MLRVLALGLASIQTCWPYYTVSGKDSALWRGLLWAIKKPPSTRPKRVLAQGMEAMKNPECPGPPQSLPFKAPRVFIMLGCDLIVACLDIRVDFSVKL